MKLRRDGYVESFASSAAAINSSRACWWFSRSSTAALQAFLALMKCAPLRCGHISCSSIRAYHSISCDAKSYFYWFAPLIVRRDPSMRHVDRPPADELAPWTDVVNQRRRHSLLDGNHRREKTASRAAGRVRANVTSWCLAHPRLNPRLLPRYLSYCRERPNDAACRHCEVVGEGGRDHIILKREPSLREQVFVPEADGQPQ